jgi:NAD(P)H dehydrogenase (quinone)
MIVVTGGTGQLGRQIVEGLSRQIPNAQIAISVRNPEKAQDFKRLGMRVCKGDFADSAGLAEAFEGAEQVLIVSVNKFGEEAVRQHHHAIQAAKDAGAKRILYTSHQGANLSSAFAPGRDHAATEALLQSSGVPYVSLRNGFYAESALFQLSGLRETGQIALPEDGPVSWTARADLAEAAVAALTEPGLFDGISPPLTNSQPLDFADIARIASAILGRTIVRKRTSDEEYRMGLISHGLPAETADGLGGLYKASRAREFAAVDPSLERLLGRPPVSMQDVLDDFLRPPENKWS